MVGSEVRALIKEMAQANPLWGAPRIHEELIKLGIDISERTVSRLISKWRKPPSQTWRTFLDNHFREIVSVDFLTMLAPISQVADSKERWSFGEGQALRKA
jgi:putative transposase